MNQQSGVTVQNRSQPTLPATTLRVGHPPGWGAQNRVSSYERCPTSPLVRRSGSGMTGLGGTKRGMAVHGVHLKGAGTEFYVVYALPPLPPWFPDRGRGRRIGCRRPPGNHKGIAPTNGFWITPNNYGAAVRARPPRRERRCNARGRRPPIRLPTRTGCPREATPGPRSSPGR